MNIYKLTYNTAGTNGKTIILVNDASVMSIKEALSRRDKDFSEKSTHCKITRTEYLSIDMVKMSDLSFGDYMRLFEQYKGRNLNYL